MLCLNCGEEISAATSSCPYCGQKTYLPKNTTYSEACKDVHTNKEKSPSVSPYHPPQQSATAMVRTSPPLHTTINAPDPFRSLKKRGVCVLLCFFFGCLGVHRFYVGKIGTGILWLLTCGMFGIGVIVDLLQILFGNFRDQDGRRISYW